jgi:hypothetical protein
MTFVRIYLVGYFLLCFGAVFALGQAGVLSQIPGTWIALACGVAVAFGVLLAVVSSPHKVTTASRQPTRTASTPPHTLPPRPVQGR